MPTSDLAESGYGGSPRSNRAVLVGILVGAGQAPLLMHWDSQGEATGPPGVVHRVP